MEEQTKREQTWWQKNKELLIRTGLIALVVVVVVLLILIILGYIFNWDWTGLNANYKTQPTPNIIIYQPGKTLWDWLGLLGVIAIPVVVGLFTFQQGRASDKSRQHQKETELQIATDNQREAALQAYMDKMSDLILKEGKVGVIRQLSSDARQIARIRTLTILHRLDADRKGNVIQFLSESQLVDKIPLNGADLSTANLRWAHLEEAQLVFSDLSSADLREAYLMGANLSNDILTFTNLSGANLSGANLSGDNLSGANLTGAILEIANLKGVIGITVEALEKQAKSLKGATMPNGKMYPNSSGANLEGAKLSGLDLSGVDLSNAILFNADLSNANLDGANLNKAWVTREQVEQAKSLKGATMPDGSIHP